MPVNENPAMTEQRGVEIELSQDARTLLALLHVPR